MPNSVAGNLPARGVTCLMVVFLAGCGNCPQDLGIQAVSPTGTYVGASYISDCGGPVPPINENLGLRPAVGGHRLEPVLIIRDVALSVSLIEWVDDHNLIVTIECPSGERDICLRTDRYWSVTMPPQWNGVHIEYRPGPNLVAAGGPDVMEAVRAGRTASWSDVIFGSPDAR